MLHNEAVRVRGSGSEDEGEEADDKTEEDGKEENEDLNKRKSMRENASIKQAIAKMETTPEKTRKRKAAKPTRINYPGRQTNPRSDDDPDGPVPPKKAALSEK